MKIALLGGSFDPIHNGHIDIAKAIKKNLNVNEVWFIPAFKAPLKDNNSASYKDRCNMIKLAIKPYRYMKLSKVESKFKDISFTINTIKYLKKYYNHEFIFVIGSDQVNQLDKWYKVEELLSLIPFYYVGRGKTNNKYNITNIKYNENIISSTLVREGYLEYVSYNVKKYILDNNLYYETLLKRYINEERYKHSISVANLAIEIAKYHNMNLDNVFKAGLYHDIAKNQNKEQLDSYMNYYCNDMKYKHHAIWHGYVGSIIAKKYLLCNNKICNAIYNHVEGKNNNKLNMLIYICDKLDPLRGYDSSANIQLAKQDLNKAFEVVQKEQLEYINKRG